ncbi:MAG: YdhR family protein [Chitinophagaceae bacterium]|nr:YdhR family protein [Chitinophagaceae bacterium]
MAQKILVTKYKFNVSPEEYKQMVSQLGQPFADVPGCQWKIWLIDEDRREGGAVYLFRDEQSLEDFKASPLVASVMSHPALSDFDLRVCDILKEVSEVTRAPLMEEAVAS